VRRTRFAMTVSSQFPEPEARGLPTGTVTFAFTDIEGSSARWESDRGAMQEALRRHDAILRAAVVDNGGHVFKTIGDAFCCVFSRSEDAVAAMTDAQRAIAAEDFSAVGGLRVRAALHTGTADERDADYFGPAVNRVARLLAVGHGGQTLLSGVTRALAYADLASGTSLSDLGSHRLKDLTEPERVWQLEIAGLRAEFPPLRSLDALPNNLPLQATSFVGRDSDVAEVIALVARHRLLTLFGTGGVGKTRLAVQVGSELLDQFPEGVWFVDLAPITDPELVASVVAKALGMSQQDGQRADESIPPWLKRKKLLLIFDNCEHLLGPVAALTAAILRATDGVRILTTSRQALDVAGEAVYRLPSLSVPSEAAGLSLAAALGYGAFALFVDRAQTAHTGFRLTDDTAPIVTEICRRLDGIPLAIELAAARVKVLSIHNLSQRLNERFRLLTGGSRDVLPRQKTLGALIDWSYDLLTEREQLFFVRLGIFAGDFGLDAATAVCSGDALDELDVLDLITSLADKSLVVADTSGEHARYRLLESTGAYALEKLAARGEREILSHRHAEYFRDKLQEADVHRGDGQWVAARIARAEPELDNHRAALNWALTLGNDPVIGGGIAGALYWRAIGLEAEGRYWVELALAHLDEEAHPGIAGRLWLTRAGLSNGKRKLDAAERAIRLFEAADVRWTADAYQELAFALMQTGRLDEAIAANAQALAISSEHGHKTGVARSLSHEASIETLRGNVDAARAAYGGALAAYRSAGADGMFSVLSNLAELEFSSGRPEEALRRASEALEGWLQAKSPSNIAGAYCNIAAYSVALEDYAGARESARQGLHWAQRARDLMLIGVALQHLSAIWAFGGNAERAARLLGYVDAQIAQLGTLRELTEKWEYDELMSALRETLSDDEIASLAREGAAWSEDRAVDEALEST